MSTKIIGAKLAVDENGETVFRPTEPLSLGLTKRLLNGSEEVGVEIPDNRTKSYDQVKKCFALFHDVADWWGETDEHIYEYFGMRFGDPDKPFHLSSASKSDAAEFLDYIIDFCFKHKVDFTDSTWDSIPDVFGKQWYCMQNRRCILCGDRADYCHVETVGMGSDRSKVDHSKYHFMALCRKHHTEQHTIGINTFIRRHHIKPIKLTRDQCVDLGIMTYKSAAYFNEWDAYLRQIGAVK